MKIVVVGGTGRIGSIVVNDLRQQGHEAVPASPETGINTLTGEGLAEVLDGAAVVVDVSNSPSFEESAAFAFFETSTRNVLDADAAVGVGHHVVLSVVGVDRLKEIGYMRAKLAQERLVKRSSVPFTIVHATQFFEFVAGIADSASDGETVRVPPVRIQPMAAADVAAEVCTVALARPRNNMVETGGPERLRFEDFVRDGLRAAGDERPVIADPEATYYGARLNENTLLPGEDAQLSATRFDVWLTTQQRAS